MSELMRFLGSLPTAAVVGLAVLVIVQLSVQVIALLDLAQRGQVPGGRKWLWVLIIIFGNLVGAIVYLVIIRSAGSGPSVDRGGGGSEEARKKALDRLYGDREGR